MPSTLSYYQNKSFVSTSKNLLKTEIDFFRSGLFHIKNRVSLKYFINDGLWKQVLVFSSPETLSSLMCLTIFAIFDTVLTLKLETLISKKVLKFTLYDNYFPNILAEAQNRYWKPFKNGLGHFFEKYSKL